MSTNFPNATIVGYPRIGRDRELKFAVESFWRGDLDESGLDEAVTSLKDATYARLAELGLDATSGAIPGSFSLYDQVLDQTVALNAIPARFEGLSGLELYFALGRGTATTPPLEMTKWFDTNYHYLIPELDPDTTIEFTDRSKVDEFIRAREAGYVTRPVLVGPVTWLALAKEDEDVSEGWGTLDLLDRVVEAYKDILAAFAAAGASWVQFDEPALVSDNLPYPREQLIDAAVRAWNELGAVENRPSVLLTLPYGNGEKALRALVDTPVEAIQVDFKRTPVQSILDVELGDKTLVAGVVEGRDIWRANLLNASKDLQALQDSGFESLAACTATSLQHVPLDASREQWDDPELNEALHQWLAFSDQKVEEVVLLGLALKDGWDQVAEGLVASDAVLALRQEFPGVVRQDVRAAATAVTDAERAREPFEQRRDAQIRSIPLPNLPTTTIGSFPQTREVRAARSAFLRGAIDQDAYTAAMQQEVADVIKLQENLGIDVLVHGEPERNDMVQYFAEQLDGYAATKHGWVQSYGSRCTRPSIIWGDVARPNPMTVEWAAYAQSLTDKPVKGMLTGPTTMIAWSFPRPDLAFGDIADQIGLALRDEVNDLEAAGIQIIQVDEPALRELLPLDAHLHHDYLDRAVGAFRLATSGVSQDTQIHTHLCYSEFGQIIDAIAGLDADVTSIEAARSRMELLPQVRDYGYIRGLGPGVWDIHSPRIPSVEELADLLRAAAQSLSVEQLWSNPDCGLKTRDYPETKATLENLVAATQIVRDELTTAN